MEINKLTICRQDVIIVSDTESESNEVNLHRRKKLKHKTECVRNVKLIKTTVNRIVPFCYRQRCRNSQHHHRQTSKNTKYRKRKPDPAPTKCYKKHKTSTKSISYENNNNNSDMNMVLTRDLYSPITIVSSSDMYESISSCSFNILSSDSDELEDLITITRKRMKNDCGNFNSYPLRKSAREATTQDDYQNISSNDEIFDSSIHSMDTVLLYNSDTSCRESSEYLNDIHLTTSNNNISPMSWCKSPNLNSNELRDLKIPSLSSFSS